MVITLISPKIAVALQNETAIPAETARNLRTNRKAQKIAVTHADSSFAPPFL
jgi:hypothetical protein